jgi:NitT/TauT family transport system permease protein
MTTATLPAKAVLHEEVSDAQATHARDYGAVIVLTLTLVFYNVVDIALREESQIGLAFRNWYLRRVLWVLLAATAGSLIIGRLRGKASPPIQIINGIGAVLVALFTVNVGLFAFFGSTILTEAPLTSILALGTAFGAIVLSAPWERVNLWRQTIRQVAPALVLAALVVVAWEVIIQVFEIKQFLLPKPSVIGQTLADAFPDLVSKSWVTFQNALWGYAIGCALGVLVGLASARFQAFSRAVLPFAIAANSIPLIAFAPIMGFWFGVLNPASKISVVAVVAFFPCMINTVKGLLSADQGALELMRSLAVSELAVFRKVRFPAALPYIFNGLKFCTTWCVITALVAEFFGGSTLGIGYYIRNKPTAFDFPATWAAIIVVSLLGVLFYLVVSLVERVLMPWHVAFRQQTK